MSTNTSDVPKHRKLTLVSNPELVIIIRRLLNFNAVWKLTNTTESSSPVYANLKAALAEAKRRNITINHPELL